MKTACKICASDTWSFFNKTFEVTYHVCTVCELIFKEPQDLITREEEFSIYEFHQNSIEDPAYVAYFRRFIEDAVLPYENGGKVGLDFGSGPSPVLAMLLERDFGYHMDIYDLFYSPDKVHLDKTYDLVVSTEVVEHLADPIQHFKVMKAALKADGILAVMTQFHQNDLQHFSQWHYMRDRSHIAFYTRKTMETLASKLDLQIIFCDDKKYTTFRQSASNDLSSEDAMKQILGKIP